MRVVKVVLLVVGLVALLGAGLALGSALASNDTLSVATTVAAAPSDSEEVTRTTASVEGGEQGPVSGAACDFPAGGPFIEGVSVDLIDIGEEDGVRVKGAVYPRPDYEGGPWSQWGQGLALSDGRFLSAIGDHIGQDGNSYLYEYDSDANSLTMIGDVLSYVDHEPGSWGYGKIHGQMVRGSCGEVYFATYWGSNSGLQFGGGYAGDLLFRLDPQARTISPLEVPVPEHGIPSLTGSPDGRLLYGEAVDPILAARDVDQGPFFVYDTIDEEVIFTGPPSPHVVFRNVMVDASGRGYYAMGDGQLAVYDPQSNAVTTHGVPLPGEALRASTRPTPDGRIFGVTDDEAELFAFEPTGDITSLGSAHAYTTSMVADPDGSRFFFIPDAHGGAWASGALLISVDAETGEQTVLAQLNPMVEANLGLRLGGTYNVAIDESGDRLYIGMNAGPFDSESGFGEVVLLVVDLA